MILSIDQGTTSTRALLFTEDGAVADLAQKELALTTPYNGWVEQDARAIWQDTLSVCRDVLAHADTSKIKTIGITNQRETTIVWDRKTGEPIYNAIVWQDRRTADFCDEIKKHATTIQNKTGLLCDSYFSGTKLRWILDNVDGARPRAENGDLAFGTVDSYLIWHLTGGKVHATDATNASRTMLFNIHDQKWDFDLLDMLDIPETLLPTVEDSNHHFGQCVPDHFGVKLPITGVLGDQHAALFGQAAFEPGMVKSTYGTGCFALMNTGAKVQISKNKLLTTMAWRMNGQCTYAIEGSIFVAGSAVQFLRDNLKIIDSAKETEKIARSVENSDGVIFIPALTGLGAPYWDPHARGTIFGLTRGTTNAHIVRATLEAQAFQTRDLMTAMENDTGIKQEALRVDGGLANNDLVCQMIADQIGVTVERPKSTETTAWGAAAMAGLSAGVFSSLGQIKEIWQRDAVFMAENKAASDKAYRGWQQAAHRIIT